MRTYILSVCALTLSALTLPAQTNAANTTVETTGMIGLAQAQTAQLNLLNPGMRPPALGIICTATVTYYDAGGTVLKTSLVSVEPGASGAVDLVAGPDVSIAAGARRDIRAQISIPGILPPASTSTGTAPSAATACKLIPTLEIFDSASGHTLVSLGGMHAIPSVVATPATAN